MLIGLTGCKGSGKDTVGNYLVERYDFEKRAFAGKLKEAVANLLDITIEQVEEWKNSDAYIGVRLLYDKKSLSMEVHEQTFRNFLQRFGTEMGRNTFGEDFWVDLALREPLSKSTVFTDLRFANEASALKSRNAVLIRILRSGCEPDGHPSEDIDFPTDYVIQNDGTISELYQAVDNVMSRLEL